MLDALRRFIPAPLKAPVRRLLAPWRAAVRWRAVSGAVSRLRHAVEGDALRASILDLRSAWGNPGFTADASFLMEVATRVRQGEGPFLDCGSGLTTVVAGVLAQERGLEVWSLEQDDEWQRELGLQLGRLGIDSVRLWHTPLRVYGDVAWFDLEGRTLPRVFSHAFCDGPAVGRRRWPDPIYGNWRAGIVPVLRAEGVMVGDLILDDAEDPRCDRLRAYWRALGVDTELVPGATGTFVSARFNPGPPPNPP